MLFQPTYFAPIIQYAIISQCKKVCFEVEDHFEKQTYRNRCYIYSENGKHLLNIPIKHTKGIKQKTKDVKVDYTSHWNKQHLKALHTAYSSSPFFEFYIDDLLPIFEKQYTFLLDVNLQCHHFMCDALDLKLSHSKTADYEVDITNDYRQLVNPKTNYSLQRYIQVFEQKHGFISNLSILDLLFMEGPNALNYLENQSHLPIL